MTTFGYNTLLDVQPAIVLLWLDPLHGNYLQQIKETLQQKRETTSNS